MALTAEEQEKRKGMMTSSRCAPLMTGNEKDVYDLWREVSGDPEYEPDDLSDVWPVQLGNATEALNLDWYERKTGHPLIRKRYAVHPTAAYNGQPWAAASLDGWDTVLGCPVECKHVGGREQLETVIARYQPQKHWQMIVTGARICKFSVIEGAAAPIVETIEYDEAYGAELWERALRFMQCVWNFTPPNGWVAPVKAPLIVVKEYDFSTSNEWSVHAGAWLENVDSAEKAKNAEKALKDLVPADAKTVSGKGIKITRDRAGRLSLRKAG